MSKIKYELARISYSIGNYFVGGDPACKKYDTREEAIAALPSVNPNEQWLVVKKSYSSGSQAEIVESMRVVHFQE